jgi:hypothetical protein
MEKYFIKPRLYANGVVIKLEGSRRIAVVNYPDKDDVIISSTRPLQKDEDINIQAVETKNIRNKFRVTNTFHTSEAAYCLYIALKEYFENNINNSIKTEI